MYNYRITSVIQNVRKPSGSKPDGQRVQVDKKPKLSELVKKLEDEWDYLYNQNQSLNDGLASNHKIVNELKCELREAERKIMWWQNMTAAITMLFVGTVLGYLHYLTNY